MSKVVSVCCTSHNRKEKTLACFESLYKQDCVEEGRVILNVFLCDDGSRDGTVEAVKNKFPEVNIIKGNGDLFWARGMEVAFSEARKVFADFYLMVNDDVIFDKQMLDSVLFSYDAAKQNFQDVAVVGSIKDNNGEWSYGGRDWNKTIFKDKKPIVMPRAPYAECKLANWNCFFLPKKMADKVGNIETKYEHAMADYDYSIRILKAGGKIVTTSKFIGVCLRNEVKGTWQDLSLPLFKRYKLLHTRTARPIKSYIHYCKVAYGNTWIYWFLIQYIWIAKTSLVFRLKD